MHPAQLHGIHNIWYHLQHPFQPIYSPTTFYAVILGCAVGFFVLMTLLHKMSPQAKKWLTISCTFVAGLFFALEFFLPISRFSSGPLEGQEGNFLTPWVPPVSDFFQYIIIWTIMLGIISLALVHGRRLFKLQPGWHNSLALFIAMFAFIAAGFWSNLGRSDVQAANTLYKTLFAGLLVNLDASMFALLAFYIASAAYRAFRIRTVEAGLLMASALVVMLGMVSFGVWMTNAIPQHSEWAFFRIERLMSWLLGYINMPGQRAVLIGVMVGSLAMAMRMWLSLERGSFFSEK
jgi:hypothetical protein